MNKIFLFLGAFLLIGLVSAAVVTYFSNTAIVNVSVDQPLHLQVSSGSGWNDGPVSVASGFGGETFSYWLKAENRANAVISGFITNTIENNLVDATCADFTSIIISTCDDLGCSSTSSPQDVTSLCANTGSGSAVVQVPATYLATETEAYKIDATWAVGVVPASYTINATATV